MVPVSNVQRIAIRRFQALLVSPGHSLWSGAVLAVPLLHGMFCLLSAMPPAVKAHGLACNHACSFARGIHNLNSLVSLSLPGTRVESKYREQVISSGRLLWAKSIPQTRSCLGLTSTQMLALPRCNASGQ